jgi:predicted GNAT family acetyltransferase
MAPDGYHPRQITIGPFIGAWESNTLIATAGVHVLSKSQGIAAIGNVFTHPDWRRRGVARACLLSLLDKLEPYSPQIVVLNVEQENLAAIRLYQSIGFKIHCQFNEGLILIQ